MPKDDLTWLNVWYVVIAACSAYVLNAAFETIGIETGWKERFFEWYPIASILLSILGGALIAIVLRVNTERHEYFLASIAELRKVTWPSVEDTKKMTVIVVVVCAIFAVILAVFDVVWAKVFRLLLT